MRDRNDALREAVTEVDRAAEIAENDEQAEHLDRALLLLLMVQAFDESNGDVRETLRYALEHL